MILPAGLPWMLIGITAGMFLVGLVLVPAIVFLMAPSLGTGGRTMLARILFTISALSVEGTLLYQRATGIYDFLPVVRDEQGDLSAYDDTTGEFIVPDAEVGWSRLGKRRFGVSWEKTKDAFDVPLFGSGTSQAAIADGGQDTVSIVGERGGMPIATEYSGHENRYIVNVMKIMKRLEGAASGSAATEAERSALKEFGGDQSQMQMKWMVLGVLSAIALGGAMSYVVMGGI